MDTLRTILDFWSSYSLTARLTVFVTLVIVLSIWMFLLPWLQDHNAPDTTPSSESPTAVDDIAKTRRAVARQELPPIRVGNTIDDIRRVNRVRELINSENNLSLYQLPNGVYGWVEAYHLDSPAIMVSNSPFGPDFLVAASSTQLRRHKEWHSDVEVHKDREGIVRIVAFVNDCSSLQLQQPSRTDRVQLLLTFREYEDYRFPVSIPRDRFKWFRHRSFADGEPVADAQIA